MKPNRPSFAQRLQRGALWLIENAVLCIASGLMLFALLLALESEGAAQTSPRTVAKIARGTTGPATFDFSNSQVAPYYDGQWSIGGPGTDANNFEVGKQGDWNCTVSGEITVPAEAPNGYYGAIFVEGITEYDYSFEVVGATPTPTPTPPTPTATATAIPPTGTGSPPPPPPPPPTGTTPPPTGTSTATPTPTATATNTPTPTATATNTPTPTATATNTPTPTATATNTPTPTPTEPPRVWNVHTPVGEQSGDNGGSNGFSRQGIVGTNNIAALPPIKNGRMIAPQNQQGATPTPAAIVVALGATVPCEVEVATDEDEWTKGTEKDVSAEPVNYKWSAVDSSGAPAGSFADDTALSTTWTAPSEYGTYTLKCTIDDPWLDGQTPKITGAPAGEGDRNDKAVERKVTVYVSKVRFVEDPNQKYGFDDGTYYSPYTAPPSKSVEVGESDTAIAEIMSGTDPTGVFFRSADTNVMNVTPGQASSAPQTVTLFGGLARGAADATAHIGENAPVASKMSVNIYRKRNVNVGVAVVTEDSGTINATDIPQAAIEAELKRVFKQAVVDFDVLVRLPPKTLDFDLDGDGKLKVNNLGISDEMSVIASAYNAEQANLKLDKIIFLTSSPTKRLGGVVPIIGGRDAFIFTDAVGTLGPVVVSHELGHALRLDHTGGVDGNGVSNGQPIDLTNLMNPSAILEGRLRRFQWNILNTLQ